MKGSRSLLVCLLPLLLPAAAGAQLLPTRRIPAEAANQAVAEAVASCAKQGYNETAVLVDADGVRQAVLRGDRAGSHTLDSAFDKATRQPRSRRTPAHCSSAPRQRPASPTYSLNCRI